MITESHSCRQHFIINSSGMTKLYNTAVRLPMWFPSAINWKTWTEAKTAWATDFNCLSRKLFQGPHPVVPAVSGVPQMTWFEDNATGFYHDLMFRRRVYIDHQLSAKE
jgi:hypothetical protein